MRLWGFCVHIIDSDFAEIAHDNPLCFFRQRQIVVISLRLLKRGEFCAVALLFCVVDVDFRAFLLDNRPRFCNVSVDELGRADFHALFKVDNLCRVHHAQDVLQQSNPKPLRLLLFVAPSRPIFSKFFSRALHFFLRLHSSHYTAITLMFKPLSEQCLNLSPSDV